MTYHLYVIQQYNIVYWVYLSNDIAHGQSPVNINGSK